MIKVPLNAKVECADGPCGESITVIVNPVTKEVTHFVVRDDKLPPPTQRLVPVEQVAETTSDLVRLSCNRDQVAEMEPFTATEYVEGEMFVPISTVYGEYYQPYVVPVEGSKLPMEVERIPPGELAVRRGTPVEAADGYVGQVGELLVDPESGQITHLILREGHLFGKKEVMLPLSAIENVLQDTVYLKLDKNAVKQLPAIPVKRHYATGDETYKKIDLVARVFDDPDKAAGALEFMEDLHRQHRLEILNAAVLVKDEEGNVSVKDTRDIDPRKGRVMGAITGGLIGLVGGPVGVVVGALTGAGAGSLAGKWIDFGFSEKFLTKAQEYLQPGTSALILLVEHEWVRPVSEALADVGGLVLQQTLTDRMVEDLLQESGAEE
jgi:uncharacterized membrane protein/sporulation protein YlmC with PRC-barrel domain